MLSILIRVIHSLSDAMYNGTPYIGEHVYYRKWVGPSVDTMDPSRFELNVLVVLFAWFWNYSQPKIEGMIAEKLR